MTKAEREQAERTFCESWIETGPERASAGELLELAEKASLPIAGATLRARQTSLGRWLEGNSGFPIAGDTYRIRKLGRKDGRRLWVCDWTSSERQLGESSGRVRAVAETGLP